MEVVQLPLMSQHMYWSQRRFAAKIRTLKKVTTLEQKNADMMWKLVQARLELHAWHVWWNTSDGTANDVEMGVLRKDGVENKAGVLGELRVSNEKGVSDEDGFLYENCVLNDKCVSNKNEVWNKNRVLAQRVS